MDALPSGIWISSSKSLRASYAGPLGSGGYCSRDHVTLNPECIRYVCFAFRVHMVDAIGYKGYAIGH